MGIPGDVMAHLCIRDNLELSRREYIDGRTGEIVNVQAHEDIEDYPEPFAPMNHRVSFSSGRTDKLEPLGTKAPPQDL